jgi:hypothetical protein
MAEKTILNGSVWFVGFGDVDQIVLLAGESAISSSDRLDACSVDWLRCRA